MDSEVSWPICELFLKIALEQNATKIIVAHNHPSGNPKPSKEDQLVTDRVKAVGELMDIKLLDHVIIAEGGYYSFMDEGMMWALNYLYVNVPLNSSISLMSCKISKVNLTDSSLIIYAYVPSNIHKIHF